MRPKTAVGICSIVLGVALIGSSAAVVARALDRNATIQAVVAKAEDQCREKVAEIGTFLPDPTDKDVVRVMLNDTADPRSGLSDVTAILAMCPHRHVVDACFGTTCGPGGRPSPMRATVTLALN